MDPDEDMSKDKPRRCTPAGVLNLPTDAVNWIRKLSDVYGYKLLWMLFFAQWILKGFVYMFIYTSCDWLLRAYEVPGPKMQIYKAMMMLPASMKPLWGIISDMLPIAGYHRSPYMVISSLVGIAGLSVVGFVPHDSLALQLAVACLFCGMAQIMICDLMTEAKYAEKMREFPQYGPDLMSFVWMGVFLGHLVATACTGVILENWGPKVMLAICVIPACFIIFPTCMNWLEEKKETPAESQVIRQRFYQQKEVLILVFLMAMATLSMVACGLAQDNVYVNLGVALTMGMIVNLAFLMLTRPIIGLMNCYFFIQTALTLNMEGAMFYFFTDGPKQYPNGPHFSIMFYTTGLGVILGFCNLVGIWTYNNFGRAWRYHRLFFATNLLYSCVTLTSVLVYSRYNLKIGIPDTAFVVGSTVIQSIVMQWMWIPGVVLLSQLCPKSMEATMYALLAGCHNLGMSVGSYTGAALMTHFGITPDGSDNEGDKFRYLWIMALIASVLPCLTLVLLPYMIPNAYQTDKLIKDNADATGGSYWRQLRGYKDDEEEESETMRARERYGATSSSA